MPFMVVDV